MADTESVPAVADTESPAPRPLRDLIRHTLVYGSGYITMAAVSFLLVPIYTRELSPSGYGLLGLMLVLYGLMTQVYDFGFTNAVGRFFFDSSETESREAALARMRATGLTFLFGYGALLTAILLLFASTWSAILTGSDSHADLVRIVALTLYAEALVIVPLTLIRMQERSRLFVTITMARFAVTLSLSILFVVVLDLDVQGALLANAASALAVLVVLLPDYRFVFKARASVSLLREMLSFGVPFFPVLLSAWVIEAADRYLIGLYRSHAEVGYYVLGYKVAQVIQIAVAAFSMGWAPLRYRIYGQPDAPQTYRRLTSYYALAATTLTVGVALFARAVVDVVAPGSYTAAAVIVPMIAASYALNGLYVLTVTGMGVAKHTKPMLWIVGVAALANIGLNIILIPEWGITAAAWTTVLGNVMMAAGGWFYSQRVYPIPYDWARIGRSAGLASAVVAIWVVFTPGTGAAGVVWAAAGWIVFVVLVALTGTVRRDELRAARAMVRNLLSRRGRRSHAEGAPG